MFKVILLILLFDPSTGEIKGIWSENGALPSFETVEQCEAVVEKDVLSIPLPNGLSIYAECIFPGKDGTIAKGTRT